MDPTFEPGPEPGEGWSGPPDDAAPVVGVAVEDGGENESVNRHSIARILGACLALVLLLAGFNGVWAPARAMPNEIEMVTDVASPDRVVVPAESPQVTNTAATVPASDPVPTEVVDVGDPPLVTPSETVEVPAATVVATPTTTPPLTDPALVARPIPDEPTETTTPAVSPFANDSRVTAAGYTATSVGCASGTSAAALDAFFAARVGPVIGEDYQHVYPLGGSRFLWLFQDTFVDYSGVATNFANAAFVHNTAMIQDGACFTLYHRGSIAKPASFEQGTGESRLGKWFWPMGGQAFGNKLYVFWAEMQKDNYEPQAPNGLGWHPARTWLAVYDVNTLARLSFQAAPNSGVLPIYGYAVESDAEFTYLFGNTFEQNLQREGGYFNGPHSATKMFLARVPLGQFGAPLEYRSGDSWSYDAAAATPIVSRYWAENPMQPRYLNGQWVAVTKVNGYWGESLSVDVANDPWGPWTTTESRSISPRGGDPLMNTYHAHLMPWLDRGSLVVSISQNARNMARDAWPMPSRYRLAFFSATLVAPPPREEPVESTTTSSIPDTVVTDPPDTGETTTTAPTTVVPDTTTTSPPTSTTTPASTTTTTTVPPTTTTIPASTTTTTPATTTTAPAPTTTPPASTP